MIPIKAGLLRSVEIQVRVKVDANAIRPYPARRAMPVMATSLTVKLLKLSQVLILKQNCEKQNLADVNTIEFGVHHPNRVNMSRRVFSIARHTPMKVLRRFTGTQMLTL